MVQNRHIVTTDIHAGECDLSNSASGDIRISSITFKVINILTILKFIHF